MSTTNLRLAFASALLMCVFQVCLLSKVILRYVTLSVCCSSVSSNIIFMGFDLGDKVKSVLKDLVYLSLHTSLVPSLTRCWLLLGVVFWQLLNILLCSIGLSRLHTFRTSLGMHIF